MNVKPKFVYYDIRRMNPVNLISYTHENDVDTQVLEVSMLDNGEPIELSVDYTYSAAIVNRDTKALINDNISCELNDSGNVLIPIDNFHTLGAQDLLVELTVTDTNGNQVLVTPFPLWIHVNASILDDAQVTPESQGTVPELLEEAKEALENAGDYESLENKPQINGHELVGNKSSDSLGLQNKLTAGENITIDANGEISATGGTDDYEELTNKPQINSHTLSGNKSSDDLGLQKKLTAGTNITITNDGTISASGGVTSYSDLTDKPQINGVTLTGNRTLLDLGTLNFRPSYQNPPTSTSELMETPCIWYNRDDKTAFYLLNVDETQAPREYYYTWSRFNNRIVVSNEAVPERSPNNTDYEYDVGDIWVQTEMDSNDIKALYICIVKKRVTVNYKTWYFKYTWAPLSQGSTQIVSGVVNANGTITFTDSEGNTFTTSGESVIGADGFSPVATVTQTASGATVSITDKNGTTTANISNGVNGSDYILTAQDKSDIAAIVLSELPTTQGVLYGN